LCLRFLAIRSPFPRIENIRVDYARFHNVGETNIVASNGDGCEVMVFRGSPLVDLTVDTHDRVSGADVVLKVNIRLIGPFEEKFGLVIFTYAACIRSGDASDHPGSKGVAKSNIAVLDGPIFIRYIWLVTSNCLSLLWKRI
jgi:hypothetical protein